ncbi:hypothetical protein PS712_05800 [Pseudomonas fluorescens]|uniref:Uncharacterized protein n=1 Tax=Pseudomonas fluorescens TaxID=294 RepID=A0A5E7FNH8_PSEFL|nr:hypothetical protein PS712_05800 [Pseudomonas fluorescens]
MMKKPSETSITDLSTMSPAARSAAMRGGMEGWGQVGGLPEHIRYMEALVPKSRKLCHCGCRSRKSHVGKSNGVALMSGCELVVRRWVRA